MATALVPLAQYLNRADDFEPDADYVDGEIELRPIGQYDHATWQDAIDRAEKESISGKPIWSNAA